MDFLKISMFAENYQILKVAGSYNITLICGCIALISPAILPDENCGNYFSYTLILFTESECLGILGTSHDKQNGLFYIASSTISLL